MPELEPTYVYKKGEGWVVQPSDTRWKVLFHEGNGKWRNANHKGSVYKNYDRALERYTSALARKEAKPEYYRTYQWKLVPSCEFPENAEEDVEEE
jgi:hypothetical protein